jgi:hypothetical protein
MTDLATLADRLATQETLSDADVLALRRAIFPDGTVCAADVGMLWALHDRFGASHPAWSELFIEAMVVSLLEQASPRGYLSEADAVALIARIDRDGRVSAPTEFELLVQLIERAVRVPADLVDYALAQVVMTVLSGTDSARPGQPVTAGVIDDHEVHTLRRLLMGAAGDHGLTLSRVEAELLFDLADASRDAANAAGWQRLFVQGIASYLMQGSRRAAPSAAEALRREAWLREAGSVSRFLGRMAGSLFKGSRSTDLPPALGSTEDEAAARMAEAITAGEADWLVTRMARDGVLSADEQALLAFLDGEAPQAAADLRARVAELRRLAA